MHDLNELLFIALMATLCGATSCCDIALFARMKAYLWAGVLKLEYGFPSHDTFSRIFRMLDPEAFESAFQRFMASFAQAAKIKPAQGVVALDGKALRRGYERGMSHMPPVMVTAWAAQTRMALANILAPGNNEVEGAMQLVGLLQLKGCVVTADALHCHRAMAGAIVQRGGDYLLAVKENQPALLRDAKSAIAAQSRKRLSNRRNPPTPVMDAGKHAAPRLRGCRTWPPTTTLPVSWPWQKSAANGEAKNRSIAISC